MKYGYVLAFGLLAAGLGGASAGPANGAESKSPIVQRLEAAGAGDVSSVSEHALVLWFTQHKDLASEVAEACMPIRKSASASWSGSVEAKICETAVGVAAFNFRPAAPAPTKAW